MYSNSLALHILKITQASVFVCRLKEEKQEFNICSNFIMRNNSVENVCPFSLLLIEKNKCVVCSD